MQKELLAEIKELKAAISILIGTSDLLPEEQFSKEALDTVTLKNVRKSFRISPAYQRAYPPLFRNIKKAQNLSGAYIPPLGSCLHEPFFLKLKRFF